MNITRTLNAAARGNGLLQIVLLFGLLSMHEYDLLVLMPDNLIDGIGEAD